MASFDSAAFSTSSFSASAFDIEVAAEEVVAPAQSGISGSSSRRWAVKKNGKTYLFDDVYDIENFLKEEPGERTVVREEGKKTVVLKSKHKLPEVEQLVNQWKLETPQIALPTISYLEPTRLNDANLVPKRDTDEEDFMEFLSIV